MPALVYDADAYDVALRYARLGRLTEDAGAMRIFAFAKAAEAALVAALPYCENCGERVTGLQVRNEGHADHDDRVWCSTDCRDDYAEADSQARWPTAGWAAMGGVG